MQAGGGDLNAAVNALAIGASFNASQRGLYQIEFSGLMVVQRKFQIARGVHLRVGVLHTLEMLG